MNLIKLNLQNTPIADKIPFARLVADLIGKKVAGFARAKTRPSGFLRLVSALDALVTQRNEALALAASFLPKIATAEAAVDREFTAVATDVETDTNNDPGEIKSVGLTVRAVAGPTTAMPQVENLHVSDGEGIDDVDLSWNGIRSASRRNYVIRHCPDINAPVWVTVMDFPTVSKATVKNLPTGVKQWFQMAANGPNGLGPWSEPVAGTPV